MPDGGPSFLCRGVCRAYDGSLRGLAEAGSEGWLVEAIEAVGVRSDVDEAARRRVGQAVTSSLKRAAPMLEEEGVSGRMFSGLWNASISMLLLTVEPEDAVFLLEDRAARVVGFGGNAGASLAEIADDPEETARRRDEIVRAARIFSGALEAALEDVETAGIAEYFPECMLDKMVEILDREWGPWHLRRALAAQAALLVSGEGAVVDVREPVRVSSGAGGVPSARRGRLRAVLVRVESDVVRGHPKWAYVMHTAAADGSGFSETREAVCPAPEGNAARALLEGVAAALEAVRLEGNGAHVTVETSLAAVVGGVASPGARAVSDSEVWKRIDDLRAGMEIDWRRHVAVAGAQDEPGRRCAGLLSGAAGVSG